MGHIDAASIIRSLKDTTAEVTVEVFGSQDREVNALNQYLGHKLGISEGARLKDLNINFFQSNTASYTRHQLKTDLHTHFGSALSSLELMNLMVDHSIGYPKRLLNEILPDNTLTPDGEGNIDIALLSRDERGRLCYALDISEDRKITFAMMEKIYRYRRPIVQNKSMFIPILDLIAKNNASNGIHYTELSFSGFVDPEILALIDDNIERIEAENDTNIRFLVGLWRHSDPEWNEYEIEKVKHLLQHPYLAGIDYMGHESNSSSKLINQVVALSDLTAKVRPDFVYRFHAGETAFKNDNVKQVVDFAVSSQSNVRIGHGLYGLTTEIMSTLSENDNITLEFNPISNLALNHSSSFDFIRGRIIDSIDANAKCVIGTDGAGMYKATPEGQALILGLSEPQRLKIRQVEDAIIEQALTQSDKLKSSTDWRQLKMSLHQINQPETTSNSDEVIKASNKIRTHLGDLGVKTINEEVLHSMAKERQAILFSGASTNSWATMSKNERQAAINGIADTLEKTSPSDSFIITGGTDIGFEKAVHKQANSLGFEVVGTLTMDADISEIKENTITQACIIGENLNIPTSWFDKSPLVVDLIRKEKGLAVFAGGGQVIRDEIYSLLNDDFAKPYSNVSLLPGTGGATEEAITEYSLQQSQPHSPMYC